MRWIKARTFKVIVNDWLCLVVPRLRGICFHLDCMYDPSVSANGDRITRMFAAIDSRNWDDLADLLHSEIVYDRPGFDAFLGRDRVMRFYMHERIIIDGYHTIDGVIVEGERVAAWGWIEAVRDDGEPLTLGFSDVYLFEVGKIRTRRSHFYVPAV